MTKVAIAIALCLAICGCGGNTALSVCRSKVIAKTGCTEIQMQTAGRYNVFSFNGCGLVGFAEYGKWCKECYLSCRVTYSKRSEVTR
jgi:hypothetical protein